MVKISPWVKNLAFVCLGHWVGLTPSLSATYYVAPSGNDNAAGTQAQPYATPAKGQSMAQPGDTVSLRGGTYFFKSSVDEIGLDLTKSGTSGKLIHYMAYPGEIPVFDFYGMTAQKRVKGVNVTGSYLHLKGIEMKGVTQVDALKAHESWCIYVNGGNHNVFETLNLHHHMGPGLFIVEGADNLVLNCDSHDNYDAYSYAGDVLSPGENADGFGFHGRKTTSTGNVFRGCRAWWNADDGYDFIYAATDVLVENCWAWNNGYKAGTTQAAGNGNGFKVGGYGLPPTVPDKLPQHTVRFSLAFNNRAAGFYQNHHPVSNFYYNNTSFNNKAANFNLLGYGLSNADDKASLGILRNNVAFQGTALSNATSGNGVDAKSNSWNLSLTVSNNDFQSVDTNGVGGPRQADGGLPHIPFLKLKSGSALIDKGVDIQLPFTGSAPDLGADEYGAPTGIHVPIRIRTGYKRWRLQGSGWSMQGHDVSGRRIGSGIP